MADRQRRYRVHVGLEYPTDPDVIRRLRAGEPIPMAERGLKRAEPGDIVADLPEASVPWLLGLGAIEEVGRDG